MRHIGTLFLLALWPLLVRAFPTRQEEDETPQWTYVPSPRTRGTWTILSTSCTALIASTWSVLHLNIPKQRQDGGQSWKDRAKNTIRDSAFPIKWALAAIIAPESLVGFAFSDWMHAKKTESLLQKYGKGRIQSWDRTQIYFANMGGFVFQGDETHMLRPYDQIPKKRINIYPNGTQILLAQRLCILQEPPEILTREIEDKSKNPPFTKIFLALPLVVLTCIVIARASKSLPVSQLEFSVSAYGICTIFASAFYWSKPQSVGVPKISSTGQLRPMLDIDQWVMSRFGGTSFIETNFCPPFGADPDRYYRRITKNISNDTVVGNFCTIFGTTLHNADFASVLVGTIFGALYCLCWNSVFPSTTEKYLWRIASVFVTSGLVPYAIANSFFTIKYRGSKTRTGIWQKVCLYILLSCYILARLFFIFEMFWTLFYQP
ncbi:hypothetical protein CC80DRAFT_454672, partial [Byssothecium circinans]